MELMEHQLKAIELLGNGKILWGNVGSGKSATVLGYYMKKEAPRHICVITTAKKRDSLDWEGEAAKFGIGTVNNKIPATNAGYIVVDSWNNLSKYEDCEDAFFVFDEQRLVGTGSWVKSFLKIAKNNHWVMLSATPGDVWLDYAPLFIANGFYKNISDFKRQHVIYEAFTKYPKVRGYLNEQKLEILRNNMLVEMTFISHTNRIVNNIEVGFNGGQYDRIVKDRWNVFEDRPIKDVAEMWRCMRKVVNLDESRLENVRFLMGIHPRIVIFYNFNYELSILRTLQSEIDVYEWNGHKKDPVPNGDRWVYLVQYVAGAEGWNCTQTDAMVLYSLTYSYKNFIQAQGRIDRLDTPYTDLYYYVLVSRSRIDMAVQKALKEKKNFNWKNTDPNEDKKDSHRMKGVEEDILVQKYG